MSSKVEIVNIAISHLGTGKSISNIETEKSEEANTARLFYDTAINKVLEDFAWPFATRIAALGLVETEPNSEWYYSYRYPTDCLTVRRVVSGERTDNQDSAAPYRIVSDDAGRLIWTDEQDAQIEYTAKITSPHMFTASFVLAASYLLASLMAPRLTKGDQFGIQKTNLQMYEYALGQARSNAMNEGRPDNDTGESGFTRVR